MAKLFNLKFISWPFYCDGTAFIPAGVTYPLTGAAAATEAVSDPQPARTSMLVAIIKMRFFIRFPSVEFILTVVRIRVQRM